MPLVKLASKARKSPITAPVAAVEDAHVRPAGAAWRGDDVGLAVAIDVTGRHANAAGEVHGVGEEAEHFLPVDRIEGPHVRSAAGVGPGDHQVLACRR